MLHTLKLMKIGNPKVKTNNFTLTIHCVVLVLNLISVMLFSVPPGWLTNKQYIIKAVFLIAIDTFLQLCICYICWTMGSNVTLRYHDLNLKAGANGLPVARLTTKESIMTVSVLDNQTVYTSSVASESSELAQHLKDSMISYN